MTLKPRRVGPLINLFSGAAIVIMTQGDGALAQDSHDFGAINDNSPAVTLSTEDDFQSAAVVGQSSAVLPPHLRFKPLELCQRAEEETPDDIKALAMDNQRFTAVHRWGDDVDRASQILTYRLCHEENLAKRRGDTVVLDVLFRLREREWTSNILKPFLLTDPAFYIRIKDAMGAARIDQITHTNEQLMEAARDPDRAERMIAGRTMYADVPDYDAVVRQAFMSDPTQMFYYQNYFRAVFDQQEQQAHVELLEEYVSSPESARRVIRNYDQFRDFDANGDIMRMAVRTFPEAYFERESNPNSRNSPGFSDFFPSAQILLEASVRPLPDVSDFVRPLFRYYEQYKHLPEAREILENSVDANPVEYASFIAGYIGRRGGVPVFDDSLFDGVMPFIKAGRLLSMAEDERRAVTTLLYCDISAQPGCDEAIERVKSLYPAEYLRHFMNKDHSREQAERPDFDLTSDQLKSVSDVGYASRVLRAYPYYAHYPDAKDIAAHVIRAYPDEYFELVRRSRLHDDLAGDVSLYPTLADIKARIDTDESDKQAMQRLFSYASFVTKIEGGSEFIHALMNEHPYQYFLALSIYARMTNAEDDSVRMFPDVDVILDSLEHDHRNAELALRYYKYYAHLPRAEDILRRAAELDEKTFTGRFLSLYEGQFTSAISRSIVEVAYSLYPDKLAQQITGSTSSFGVYISAASGNEEIQNFLLDNMSGNIKGVVSFLADSSYYDDVEQLDAWVRERLVEMVRPAFQDQCLSGSTSYLRILERGSWLGSSNVLTAAEKSTALGCTLAISVAETLRLLEKNPDFSVDEGIVRNAVLKRSLTFLARATKGEVTADYNIAGVTVLYGDLLEDARNKIATTDITIYDRNQVINTVNNLHNYNDKTRFALIENGRPYNILYLAGASDDLYYTSSFNRIMNDAIDVLRNHAEIRDTLFDRKTLDDRRGDAPYGSAFLAQLVMNAMHFGKIEEFLGILSDDELATLTDVLMKQVGRNNPLWGYSDGSLVAAVLPVLGEMNVRGYGLDVENMLVTRYSGTQNSDVEGVVAMMSALYAQQQDVSFENKVFFTVAERELGPVLGNYMRDTLTKDVLYDENGRNFQMMVFYDDEDGHATFGHFKSIYQKDKRWKYADHGQFIAFTRGGINLYANKPQFEKEGPQAIEAFIVEQGGTLSVLVHRGHSYHVRDTADRYLDKDIQFFWLGSCRSSDIWRYVDEAPDMQFIYSQNIGTMLVNDPLLKDINDRLAEGQDIYWPQIRDDAYRMSNGDKRVKDYIFPDGSIEYGARMTLAYLREEPASINAIRQALSSPPVTGKPSAHTEFMLPDRAMPRGDDAMRVEHSIGYESAVLPEIQ